MPCAYACIYRLKFEGQRLNTFYFCYFRLINLIKMNTEVINRTFKISITNAMVGLNCLFLINFRKFYDQTTV